MGMGMLYQCKVKDGRPEPEPGKKREPCRHKVDARALVCRGCGSTFGPIWWAKYYNNGQVVRESTGTADRKEAERFLKAKLGRVATGQPILHRVDRRRWKEAADDMRVHYRTTGSRDLNEAEWRLKLLDAFFGGWRLVDIKSAVITKYVASRQGQLTQYGRPPANGTINNELAILNRVLRLAYENDKLLRLPIIRMLKAAAPQQGLCEHERYEAIRRHLHADSQVPVAVAYVLSGRMFSEVLSLQRRHLDLAAGTLRLDPGMTKNGDGRLVYLPDDLKAVLAAHEEQVRALERRTGQIIPSLFPHLGGAGGWAARMQGQRQAKSTFKMRWKTACKRAGCPGLLIHDLRRTAIGNMDRRGIRTVVRMAISGHRTRSVHDGYNVVGDADLREAARKMDGMLTGTIPGISRKGRLVTR